MIGLYVDVNLYYCVRIPVLATGMAHNEDRILLSVVIYLGNI